MKRLSIAVACMTIGLVISAPSVASADSHVASGTVEFEVLRAETSTPGPAPATPSAPTTETGGSNSSPGSSSSTTDALTILGFFVVAMGGLVLLLRSGLKSTDREVD